MERDRVLRAPDVREYTLRGTHGVELELVDAVRYTVTADEKRESHNVTAAK